MGVDDELGNIDHKFAVIDEVSELYDNLIRELDRTKKFMNERESLRMIKMIVGSKNMTLKT